jgi:hypothetical protein
MHAGPLLASLLAAAFVMSIDEHDGALASLRPA